MAAVNGRTNGTGSSSLWRLSAYTISIPNKTPAEAVKAVKAAGYEGIEWSVHVERRGYSNQRTRLHRNDNAFVLPTVEALTEARRLSEGAGLQISGLGLPDAVGGPDTVGKGLELALAAGATTIRLHGGSILEGQTYEEAYEETMRVCEAYSRVGKGSGVRAVIHQHWGTVTASASQCYRVLSQFDPELIGVIFDPGNMAAEGYEDYRLGLELLAPWVHHVHLKNVRYGHAVNGGAWHAEWAPLDDGQVDLHKLFGGLRDIDYQGWIVMSDVGEAREEDAMLAYNNTFLRQVMADVAATEPRWLVPQSAAR